ncbi:hypothetical protein [Natronosalvus caseinilyticus]|uniref:hypothetical protein n=1 Tax=Natronosalvus caseinilyticus TaxID=2953747 RepID=UPI0028AB3F91|nr:hypothetical protein [Natronosalvus caseinilyticus]
MVDVPADGNERLAALGGVCLVVSAFLPWASIDVFDISTTTNGFTGMGYAVPVAGFVALGLVTLREWTAFGAKVTAAVGVLTLLSLGVIYTSLENVFAVGYPAHYVTVSPEPGLYVAAFASALVAVAGYRGMQAAATETAARPSNEPRG